MRGPEDRSEVVSGVRIGSRILELESIFKLIYESLLPLYPQRASAWTLDRELFSESQMSVGNGKHLSEKSNSESAQDKGVW